VVRRFIFALALLFSIATTSLPREASAAEGVNLAWSHCFGEGTGVQNMTFACDTNVGSHSMTASFVLSSPLPHVNSTEMVMKLASASPTLPAWWDLNSFGACRPTSLSANAIQDPTDAVCVDWAAGQAGGVAIAAYCMGGCFPGSFQPNVAVIKLVEAVAPTSVQDLSAGVEYFSFNLIVNNVKTVGTGSCAGCSVPVCIVLNSINVVAGPFTDNRLLTTPAAPGSNYVTWQGGGLPVVGGISGCPAATPVQRSTWGSVKSLYR
jgi:hypothetical protein